MSCINKITSFVGKYTSAFVRNILRHLLILIISLIILITVFFVTKGDTEDVSAVIAGLVICTFIVKIMRYNRQWANTLMEYTGKEGTEFKSLVMGTILKSLNKNVNFVLFFMKKIGVVFLLAIPFIIATVVMFTIFKPVFNVQLLIGSIGLLFIMFLNNGIVEPLIAVCEITEE